MYLITMALPSMSGNLLNLPAFVDLASVHQHQPFLGGIEQGEFPIDLALLFAFDRF
jgi:hypothetical protein